jgi:2,3-bisphosphoglycerate-independent phosphoglycerate mutase
VANIGVILLFIDGVGLGDEAPYNPWVTHDTPNIRQILGGMPLSRRAAGYSSGDVRLIETDAGLGVPGIPQSATGQASIFTGKNAPREMGHHMSGLPFRRLREWVQAHNIYRQFRDRGWRATFANSYTPEYFQRPATKRGWVSVTTAAIQSVDEPIRMLDDLLAGRAVYHDVTRWWLRLHLPDVPEIEPEEAARHLWGIAEKVHLVVHEYFLTDRAGHKHDPELVSRVIETYDRFLGELVRLKPPEDTIVLVSDHGNSEDLRVPTHTENSVPTLVIGDVEAIGDDTENWDLTSVAPLLHRLVERRLSKVEAKDVS